ncbi:hypothetical protein AGLY_006783 [Aphis glycines]|uniref:Uncharacterized protein n=1 Tax=Aphis glycines TaxID=307491 RepID=A0A6G0TQ84_APHGL|nr:hypothetical protein AGLY_006783 [Aphis glycines]
MYISLTRNGLYHHEGQHQRATKTVVRSEQDHATANLWWHELAHTQVKKNTGPLLRHTRHTPRAPTRAAKTTKVPNCPAPDTVALILDSERSDECIDFIVSITCRNNASISNFRREGGSDGKMNILGVKSKHFQTVFKQMENNKIKERKTKIVTKFNTKLLISFPSNNYTENPKHKLPFPLSTRNYILG